MFEVVPTTLLTAKQRNTGVLVGVSTDRRQVTPGFGVICDAVLEINISGRPTAAAPLFTASHNSV